MEADAAVGLESAEVLPASGPGRSIQETVWFQGFLTDDATGEPIEATYTVTAQIYDADVAGASVWGPESHVGTVISAGWFSIELGNVIGGLPAFDTPPYYLELTIGGETMSPRLKLASVPSAFQSMGADNGLNLPYHAVYSGAGAAFHIEHDGTDPAILGVANGGGFAGEFRGDVDVSGAMHVTGNAVVDSVVVAEWLQANQGFHFLPGATAGYVLTCNDAWGVASWQPPVVPVIVTHSEESETVIGTGWTQYDDSQVTLSVPGPGWIVVEASVWTRLNHTEGTRDRVFVAISEYPNQAPTDAAAHNSWEIPESWPTGGEAGMTLYPHNTFRVSSAGTYTYYLVGIMHEGQDALDVFSYALMRGIYYPDAPSPPRG
jgi:hypothetical protein